jgi:hypothetical protein
MAAPPTERNTGFPSKRGHEHHCARACVMLDWMNHSDVPYGNDENKDSELA